MSITNRSVDRKASTAELETLLEDYLASLKESELDPNADDAHVEWLESGVEIIEDELGMRELETSLPAYDDSLEDRGLSLGSYAS